MRSRSQVVAFRPVALQVLRASPSLAAATWSRTWPCYPPGCWKRSGSRRMDVAKSSTLSGGISPLDGLHGDEADALNRISDARFSCKNFLETPVPPSVVESVLKLVLRVPTSFNVQPFRLVVVSSPEAKAKVAATVMGVNKPKVEKAAFTVVLLADLKADIHKSSDLLKNAAPEISGYADAIPGMVPIFAGENGKNTMTEWSFKNAGIVGMRLVDSATAHGLATAVIEGIEDEAGMLEAVGAPVGRYRVPFVIVVGHPDRGAEAKRLSLFKDNRTPRFGMEQIISTDTLDKSGLLM